MMMFDRVPTVVKEVNPPPLVALRHMSFEAWFVRMFRENMLPSDRFSLFEMRTEYMKLCWEEEVKYKEWCGYA